MQQFLHDEYKIRIRNLEAENKGLKEAIQAAMRIKKLWLPRGVYGADTKDEQAALGAMHMMFEQVLKGK